MPASNLTVFKVGDRVLIWRNGAPIKLTKVQRVRQRFVEMEDGSRWQHGGFAPYPNTNWNLYHAEIATEASVDALRRRLLHQKRNG